MLTGNLPPSYLFAFFSRWRLPFRILVNEAVFASPLALVIACFYSHEVHCFVFSFAYIYNGNPSQNILRPMLHYLLFCCFCKQATYYSQIGQNVNPPPLTKQCCVQMIIFPPNIPATHQQHCFVGERDGKSMQSQNFCEGLQLCASHPETLWRPQTFALSRTFLHFRSSQLRGKSKEGRGPWPPNGNVSYSKQ